MPLDPNVPLQVNTPQFAPTLSGLVQNRQQMQLQERQESRADRVAESQIQSNNARTEAARAPRPLTEAEIARVNDRALLGYMTIRKGLERATSPDVNSLQRQLMLRDLAREALVVDEQLRRSGQDEFTIGRVFDTIEAGLASDPEGLLSTLKETFDPSLRELGLLEGEQEIQFETRVGEDGTRFQVDLTTGREYPSPRNPGQPQTVVEVNSGASENAATKAYGESIGERASERVDSAEQAVDQQVALQRMREALEAGANTGFGEQTFLTLKNAGENLFGMTFENMDEQEVVQALGNQMALQLRNPESGMGLPGSTSNRDLQFLKESVPGISRSEGGNELLIDFMSRRNQMKIDVVGEQNRIIRENGGSVPPDLDEQVMRFVNSYEFFSPEERQVTQRAAIQNGTWAPPTIETREEFDELPPGSFYIRNGNLVSKPL